MRTPDGAVVPSFMRPRPPGTRESLTARNYNDVRLHVGTVIAVFKPTDDKNLSKTAYEYDVEVQTREGSGLATSSIYHYCQLQTGFGGLGDKCLWSPRVRILDVNTNEVVEPGTTVLLLANNGISTQSVIIGCMEPAKSPEQPPELGDGPHLIWEFNGLQATINKDGELTVIRKGATKDSLGTAPTGVRFGSRKDTTSGKVEFVNKKKTDGATVSLDKDGRISVQTADAKNSIIIDMTAGAISIKADKGVKVEANDGKFETDAGNGVQLGGNSEHLILGDTYVNAEKAFVSALGSFSNQMLAIATTLSAAVIEPAAAAAGAQLQAAVQLLVPAINVFKTHLETKDVLSKKNTTE